MPDEFSMSNLQESIKHGKKHPSRLFFIDEWIDCTCDPGDCLGLLDKCPGCNGCQGTFSEKGVSYMADDWLPGDRVSFSYNEKILEGKIISINKETEKAWVHPDGGQPGFLFLPLSRFVPSGPNNLHFKLGQLVKFSKRYLRYLTSLTSDEEALERASNWRGTVEKNISSIVSGQSKKGFFNLPSWTLCVEPCS